MLTDKSLPGAFKEDAPPVIDPKLLTVKVRVKREMKIDGRPIRENEVVMVTPGQYDALARFFEKLN